MNRKPETPVPTPTRQQIHEQRIAERMAARVRESARLAAEWEASRDPRERVE